MTAKRFRRILVANRGEIAVRMMRTIRDLGLESVAIYSDADEDSFHRKFADMAIRLPGRSSAETYLKIPAILEAAGASGAEAVHPGYGFLSENADFAKAVLAAGMQFIGPSPEAIAAMGDKVRAKQLMSQHEIPTVPGSQGAVTSIDELQKLATSLGFPLILKAAAGGGGRGMRVVRTMDELDGAFAACKREAEAYFGNPSVFVERYIDQPRHIEIQVLCDGRRGLYLFERDCSIQRRHQKLFEEAPSLYLNDRQRQKLAELAVKAAMAVAYQGAGTVEFICESPDKAYFMEMNTRIQVEHPVTEMITGIDLIAEQIHIAQGNPLQLEQDDIKINGWAVEARINAEDPEQDFVPRPGRIKRLHLPAGPGVRLDTHIYQGYEIPADYDSMIAKLITWAPNREMALARLGRALQELEIDGITTTASFHRALIQHPRFQRGDFSTRFLEEETEALISASKASEGAPEAIGALITSLLAENQALEGSGGAALELGDRKAWQRTSRLENHNRLS